MKRDVEDEVPRPPCGCGKPATHQIKLEVRRLELDREAGVRTKPYWTPTFRGAHTGVEALVCDGCLQDHVHVELKIDASVEKAKPSAIT